MNLRRLAIGFLLVAASCFAADVDGNWTGSMSTPGGDFPVNFTFKADGTTLTGTTTGPEGDVKISNGKVDGNNLSFAVSFDFGGMPLTMTYKGVLAKDEIKFMIDVLGMPLEVTVKKAAGAAAASSAAPGGASPIAGKWSGTIAAPTGPVPVTFVFAAEGAKLTGTSTTPEGGIVQIADGKLDGGNVSFSVSFNYGGMPITLNYKGVVAKEEIEFLIEVMGMPFNVTVKRVA